MERALGKSEINVSAIGMGCWAIGGPFSNEGVPVGWGPVDDAESRAALREAFAQGITFFDTSDAYGTGHSERMIGEVFASIRDQVIIGTKFGKVIDEARRELIGNRADEAYIRSACEA
ncbi:MAG: aldo/keto reductase, partial [Anaerolineales bacterium]|nr:aldo/keto reductase [Anaerolineales bacterium]